MSAPTVNPPAASSGTTGRPRDPRIDDAVIEATIDLLEQVGYLQLTISAIADRAGTNKPAIYRRWPTKAHLVHEAVFPAQPPDVILRGDDLRGDIRALVAIGVELLGRPAARAALPGLLAEMANDSTLQSDVLGRFADGAWGALQQRLDDGIATGEVRAGVESSTVLEMIAGSTLLATVLRPIDEIGRDWIEDVVELIMRGITP